MEADEIIIHVPMLPCTLDTLVAKGDLVMVEGILSVNKDFGAGYVYPAIIEKALVTKE